MIGQRVVIPENVVTYSTEKGYGVFHTSSIPRKQFIYFFDSTACSTCQLKHLFELTPLFDKEKEDATLNVSVVFSPQKKKAKLFLEELPYYNIEHEIVVDSSASFMRINPFLPSEPMFHTFLLDEQGKIIMVGDPLQNPKMWQVFEKACEE
jgi:hypothetical protein